MGVMGARRLLLGVLVSVCAMGVLVGGAGSAWAAGGSFLFGPVGEEAGQIGGGDPQAFGMAVDRASGDIYVSDAQSNRIDEFDGSGNFVRAWGWGVIQGANEFQVCTSATGCRGGLSGSGAGEFDDENAYGVAVDNEPGASSGDVYVVDSQNFRVQVFDSEGKFLRTFGERVNKNGTNVCLAVEASECQAGTGGEGDSEFDWITQEATIAVGPGGDVYVGDKARVQVFEPSGAWKETISLAALSSEGKVTALAVNALGDVFVKDEGVPGVREFEPDGMEMLAKFDENSEAVESIALDASGDVFIAEKEGVPCDRCDFLEYSPSGEQLESFGGKTLVRTMSAMVFDDALNELLTYGTDAETREYGHYGVWAFPLPTAGPLVESGSEKVTAESRGAATLEALVNPEGNATEVSFEYVDEADFKASGYASATSTSPVPIGSGFEDQQVVVHLPQKALAPGVTYHWRAVGHNSQGTNRGADQSFEEIPPALVEGPSAANVTDTSVTLSADIDPQGAMTSYRLEYGTSASYGHVLAGSVGEGMGYVTVSHYLQELEPNTVYHYRLVTESEVGSVQGTDRTFTTQRASGELALPDGRAWELVSPPDKGGALIENTEHAQAAIDGSGIVYAASEPIGEGISGHVGNNADATAGATVLSTRGADGWRTRDISPQEALQPEGQPADYLFGAAEAFMTFTPDLSLGVFEPRGPLGYTLLSKEATEASLYLRNNNSEMYEPLVTAANVPPGTKWYPGYGAGWEQMSFLAATPDLTHILFTDWAALTPEAITDEMALDSYVANLYEWSGGQLQLVNIVPNEKTMVEEPQPGAIFGTSSDGGEGDGGNPWAMSEDGRWVVFHYGEGGGNWYVRDMVGHKTVPFGRHEGNDGGGTKFETMSRDGSKLFYLEPESGANGNLEGFGETEGELYVLDPATGVNTDLTANHLEGERSAGVQDQLMGISEDGSYVYFVAHGVLANGAVKGQDNLYAMHDDGSKWTTTFVATLSSADAKDWQVFNGAGQLGEITSRVSPDGRYVAFMSDKSLTGYDNTDALSGQPDEEVYLYDAEANHLVCASCNPSGARPIGVEDLKLVKEVLMDQSDSWDGKYEPEFKENGHWLAASIAPDWDVNWSEATHRPAYLSDSGRLFFNSSDALVPQDTNGLADVYEYEPPGVGDCTSTSVTFDERSGGCVSLISSGQSAAESTFLEASETGDDVFFITAAKLVGEDYDTANDVYDAHVCSADVPCPTVLVSPPACSSGDSCKAAPSPQPAIFGSPPSATFNGVGNVLASPSGSGVKPKSLTRAQKLAEALKVCRKKKNRRNRAVCERQARKRYPAAKQSRTAKPNRKGNK